MLYKHISITVIDYFRICLNFLKEDFMVCYNYALYNMNKSYIEFLGSN